MEDGFDPTIRAVHADDPLEWQTIPTDPGDPNAPGEETILFRSRDARFSFGMWRRVPEEGPMEPAYHEIAVIVEGEVEVTEANGAVHRAGPGDVLITPKGSTATWKAMSPVKKFWAAYKE